MRIARLVAAAAGVIGTILVMTPSSLETAAANGDTRTLHLFHTHTGETIDATFRVDGQYDQSVLRQLNHFLRDWRNNDEIAMDPRLFDAVWEAYRSAGATDRVQIYSAYRSPETNAMLRRRSRAVAEHSQHMLGKAMDTTMPGFPMQRVRDAGMKLQRGGVGWYPSANFVHLDVGGVRSWPRMPYDQLASLFPDGKTVHIASNGQTMPGYEAARSELAQRGYSDLPPSQASGGFFAWLFGGGNTTGAAHEDEEDRRATVVAAAAPAAPQRAQAQLQQAQVQQAQVQQAQAQPSGSESESLAYAAPEAAPTAPFDGKVEVASAQSKTSDVPMPPVKLASLEPADGASLGGVFPLPPRRPADLVAAPDVPLPPVRPRAFSPVQTASVRYSETQTDSPDNIGGLITATASGVPMLRKSGLPPLITQGGNNSHAPNQALAFAAVDNGSSDSMPTLRSIPEPVARPAGLTKTLGLKTGLQTVGLRGARKPLALASHKAVVAADAPLIVGPQLTGLRRAARQMTDRASL